MPKQDVGVSLFYDGAWRSVDSDVFVAEQIKVTRGQGDEGAALRPAKVTLTFDNRTDDYRPTNPMSPLYGKAGRNTPLQVEVDATTVTTVEATSWTPDQTVGADRATGKGRFTVDLEAYGLLGRISQWSDPLRSPFTRFNLAAYASTLTGYFPLEDPRDTTKVYAPIAGSKQLRLTGMDFESRRRFAGSDPLMDIGPSSDNLTLGFNTSGVSTTAGFQISWTMRLEELTADLGEILNFTTTNNNLFSLGIQNGTDFLLLGNDASGTAILTSAGAVNFGDLDWTKWHMFRIKQTESAGTVTVEFSWIAEGSDTFSGFTKTFSGAVGALAHCGVNGGVWMNGATFGHVMGVTTGADDLESSTRVDAFNGYQGEPVGTRFLRIMDELDLDATLLGTESDTWLMGPQRSDTLLNLLQEMARTDDTLIFDSRDAIALTMRTRVDRYSQTAALALTFGVDIAPPFNEILDDLDTHNRVVMSQRDGGDYETALTTGAMSTQAPPDGVGEYKQQIGVDVADETIDLPQLGGWYLNRGTLARSRYNSVTVNLAANPELAAACNALEIGDLITVDGYEPDTVPLIVIGLVDTIRSHNRTITFTTRPAEPFQPGVYDTARYGSSSTVTGASYAPSRNTIVFRTANLGDLWSTSETPYDCICSGERFTVTTMGPDSTFEAAGLPGWDAATNGTWARSTAQAHTGTGSGLLTVVGTPAQTYVRQPSIPVTVGVSYRIAMWAYSVAGASNILAVIDWLDSGGGYLSSSSQSLTLAAATWTAFDLTGVAPASTAFAQYGPTIGSSPAAGTAIYVDDIYFQQASGDVGYLQAATAKRGVNGVRKTLPAAEPIDEFPIERYAL